MTRTALKMDDLPTPKLEEWKYTNLQRAMPKNLAPLEGVQVDIHKTRGQICEHVEEIVFTGEQGAEQNPRLSITLEEGAQLTIIERHDGQGAYWKNMLTTIKIAKNARLHHVRLCQDSEEAIHTNMVHIEMHKDSCYNGFSLNLGAKMSRHDIHAVLSGSNIECSLNGLNLHKGVQHGDTTILMEHAAPHCQSNQFYRSVLDDHARGVFQGKVHVHRIAQKTDGYQLSNAILLSEKAEMDTKPELEIYADDVKCSHGATTGQLDEEPLFYLRSRGLSKSEARQLLIQAFVDEVADKIMDETIQMRVKGLSLKWLQSVL